jgi:lipoprotein-anchoring transpeptidase ErfK/SrfK
MPERRRTIVTQALTYGQWLLLVATVVFALAWLMRSGAQLVELWAVPLTMAQPNNTPPPSPSATPLPSAAPLTSPTPQPSPTATPSATPVVTVAPPIATTPEPAESAPIATALPLTDPAPIWAIDEKRWIDVDLSDQTLTAYEGPTAVKRYLVSTGLPHTPTPLGQYRIWVKFETDDMAGADYYIRDVPWVMYFHEGYGLHGVTWHASFGQPMSHGCVNQPNEMAEWLYSFASVGTLVNIHN